MASTTPRPRRRRAPALFLEAAVRLLSGAPDAAALRVDALCKLAALDADRDARGALLLLEEARGAHASAVARHGGNEAAAAAASSLGGVDLVAAGTRVLWYLAQVSGSLGEQEASARYCHATLARQLEEAVASFLLGTHPATDPYDWARAAGPHTVHCHTVHFSSRRTADLFWCTVCGTGAQCDDARRLLPERRSLRRRRALPACGRGGAGAHALGEPTRRRRWRAPPWTDAAAFGERAGSDMVWRYECRAHAWPLNRGG